MALMKCKECGRDFSDKARACPQCGCPLAAASSSRSLLAEGSFVHGLLVRLTNPLLPRMANWMCVYCLLIRPVIFVLCLLVEAAFPEPAPIKYGPEVDVAVLGRDAKMPPPVPWTERRHVPSTD